jgi:hypothetical protein
MLRTRLAKSYIKRTIRPIYAWTQSTPKSVYLDPNWDRSVAVYPGFGFTRTGGENVMPVGGTAASPNTPANTYAYGLGALYVGGDGIDEVLDSGINAFAVWVLTPDAEFEVLAPAFDPNLTYTDNGNVASSSGSSSTAGNLLYAAVTIPGGNTTTVKGQLVPATYPGANRTANPVARVLKVNSATKLTIGGLNSISGV